MRRALADGGRDHRRGRLGEHGAVLTLDVGAHAGDVDLEAGGRIGERGDAAVRGDEERRPLGQLGLPAAEAALVLLAASPRAARRRDAARASPPRWRPSRRPDCAFAASPTSRRGPRAAGSATSPTSPCASSARSRPILPSDPHSTADLAAERDPVVALRVPRARRPSARPSRSATPRATAGPASPSVGERADRAAELQLQRRPRRRGEARARAHERRDPGDELEAEADDLRRLHQRARQDRRRRDARARARQAHAASRASSASTSASARRVASAIARVDDVLAGAAPVDDSRRPPRRARRRAPSAA